MPKFICQSINCSVYVYGTNPKCPGCGEDGKEVRPEDGADFLVWFHNVP